MPNNRPQIGVSHETREALAKLAAKVREKLGRLVSYDAVVQLLLDIYESHGLDNYDREELERIM